MISFDLFRQTLRSSQIKKRVMNIATLQKLQIFFVATGLVLLLTSCGPNLTTPYSPLQIAEVIIAAQPDMPEMHMLTSKDDQFHDHLMNFYQLEMNIAEEGVICYSDGAEASEIALFILSDATDAVAVEEALWQYIEHRAGSFAGYIPKQAALVENSIVAANGGYVALLICGDPQEAQSTFLACFSNNMPSLPESSELISVIAPSQKIEYSSESSELEPATDVFDPDAILAAWRTGESADLTEKNRSILDASTDVINEVISDSMTAYEKELTIHDWIIQWADYDEEAVSLSPVSRPDPDNENPYGLLLHKRATCRGYTTTFQLLMDMLDIECITVDGTSQWGESEHSWNMVRLDEEWYCVDVTWDDPAGLGLPSVSITHEYFNVTSDYMRYNDHQWNEVDVPVAEEP